MEGLNAYYAQQHTSSSSSSASSSSASSSSATLINHRAKRKSEQQLTVTKNQESAHGMPELVPLSSSSASFRSSGYDNTARREQIARKIKDLKDETAGLQQQYAALKELDELKIKVRAIATETNALTDQLDAQIAQNAQLAAENKLLREKNADQDKRTTCKICMADDIQYINQPCGHACACGKMACYGLEKCALCRVRVTHVIRVFL
jgi:hypothetical protein